VPGVCETMEPIEGTKAEDNELLIKLDPEVSPSNANQTSSAFTEHHTSDKNTLKNVLDSNTSLCV